MDAPTPMHPRDWLHRPERTGDQRVLDLGRLLIGSIVVALGLEEDAWDYVWPTALVLPDHSRELPADAPTLHVDALTVLGGVDIKHEK